MPSMPLYFRSNIGRIIMKSSITKITAIIVAIVGLAMCISHLKSDSSTMEIYGSLKPAAPEATDKSTATDHYNRGEAHYFDGEYDQAFSELTRAIEIKPTDAHAYVSRGVAYGNKGEYDLAVADYSKAVEIDPMITDAYRGRAGAYYYKGEYDKAWKDVYKAQALGHEVDSKLLEKLRKASGTVK